VRYNGRCGASAYVFKNTHKNELLTVTSQFMPANVTFRCRSRPDSPSIWAMKI
jgi:hypothetical protein